MLFLFISFLSVVYYLFGTPTTFRTTASTTDLNDCRLRHRRSNRRLRRRIHRRFGYRLRPRWPWPRPPFAGDISAAVAAACDRTRPATPRSRWSAATGWPVARRWCRRRGTTNCRRSWSAAARSLWTTATGRPWWLWWTSCGRVCATTGAGWTPAASSAGWTTARTVAGSTRWCCPATGPARTRTELARPVSAAGQAAKRSTVRWRPPAWPRPVWAGRSPATVCRTWTCAA